MAKKVLVRSVFREAVVKVGEYAVRAHNGQAVMSEVTRQFHDYECYMTLEEAEFLVESEENRKARARGKARYYYPAGIPVPVDEDFGGPLAPAGRSDQVVLADPGQSIAAKKQMDRAERMLAEQAKGLPVPVEGEVEPPAKPEKPVVKVGSSGTSKGT